MSRQPAKLKPSEMTKGELKQDAAREKAESSKDVKKDRPRVLTELRNDISLNQDFINVQNIEKATIQRIENEIKEAANSNRTTNSLILNSIIELKRNLKNIKSEIKSVEQSIENAKKEHEKTTTELTNEFNAKKEVILKETREVDEQLVHYAEWQRQADSFKTHLSELKSKIHQNRVNCSENVAYYRRVSQVKIEKHRVDLAEAIRKARAESLRLRSDDISPQSTTFLTQSEQQVQNLTQQLESSQHLAEVNETIEEDNMSMQQEISRLQKKTDRLRDQEEKQLNVIAKLKAIKKEFEEKEKAEAQEKLRREQERKMEQQRIEAIEEAKRNMPPKPEFKMSQDQEAFLTFLNECATTVRSVLKQLLGNSEKIEVTPKDDRFEAPKLTAMIAEIKEMTSKLDSAPKSSFKEKRPILTPAAAYFAFSAPFDDADDYIKSENWSFSKYEPIKQTTTTKKAQPKIVRIKTGNKTPL
ncbi:hypothetical protein TVAG_380330 [Trichomonas vaginalis G3]|uniref:Uncharacterized protein n=1 Tax=Trichomonas vaginalis (strain ATCC PRA-98 / G3) TaxID=412133 RepID=A2DXH1_TRIV3|nr:hypothetical protein TVAGG3_0925130 [Trichomonas vaginalis G3]EAY14923.1 hypothetical protein TVAG_380330 [Trichomonas vaginalis G3]KAI5485411.1 hypothetical protein TVAGG3_0925130 [Trichomonas vaginalis G3]|eukprot:XP_001327146.1 hypothetical protein [Trichomonas vaginalis G3]